MKYSLRTILALLVITVAIAAISIKMRGGKTPDKSGEGGGGEPAVIEQSGSTGSEPAAIKAQQLTAGGEGAEPFLTNDLVQVGDDWFEKDDPVAIGRNLDSALDDNDVDLILAESEKLKQHPDPEVRSRVVFALGWIGLSGLPTLTSMLTDPDPDVAEEAVSSWRASLSSIKSDSDKAELLGSAAQSLGETMTDDFLFDVLLELSSLDGEYALPQLADLLAATTNPEHKEEIMDTLHTMMEHEDPSEDEALLIQQAKDEALRLALEQQELNPGPEEVQGLPGRVQ